MCGVAIGIIARRTPLVTHWRRGAARFGNVGAKTQTPRGTRRRWRWCWQNRARFQSRHRGNPAIIAGAAPCQSCGGFGGESLLLCFPCPTGGFPARSRAKPAAPGAAAATVRGAEHPPAVPDPGSCQLRPSRVRVRRSAQAPVRTGRCWVNACCPVVGQPHPRCYGAAGGLGHGRTAAVQLFPQRPAACRCQRIGPAAPVQNRWQCLQQAPRRLHGHKARCSGRVVPPVPAGGAYPRRPGSHR